MIARFVALLPFFLTVPDGAQFPVYEYIDEGYGVRVFPPSRSDRPIATDEPDRILMDGIPAFQADVLRIDFYKESFKRDKGSPCDPPEYIIRRAANSFLIRLRHVTRAPQVRPLNFPWATWRLRYLNDDETELEKDERFIRGHGTLQFSFGWIALNQKVWEDVYNLSPDYNPPPWEELLLDAQSELPSIGPAIVLAATSLEVFISYVLDRLAELKSLPPELWKWINQRGDWLKEPTVDEQYDFLLKFFSGYSLKSEKKLWESFKNLRTARNTFVHKGVAKIGGAPVTTETAQQLIATASKVILKVRDRLPQELHWPEFKHKIKVEVSKKLK